MKKIFAFILIFIMSGCASPAPRFYQPVVVENRSIISSAFTGTILIQRLLLPAEISRPQITTIGQTDYELKIDEFNRWGAAPDKLFQRIIAQDLANYLPKASIEIQTPLRKNYKYAVAIEINEMTGKLGNTAYFSASYYIKNRNGNTVKTGYIKEELDIEFGYDNYVLAQSQMLDALANQIAQDLSHL